MEPTAVGCGNHTRHEYSAGQFGIDRRKADRLFARYLDQFVLAELADTEGFAMTA